jgi:hypothetical protein
MARERLEQPIDATVARVKELLREFFGQLPVRQYRAEVSRFLHEIALKIDEADLDKPANEARGALRKASEFLTSNGLAGQVQAQLQELNQRLSGVLDGIEGPLTDIATQVDNLAGQATAILNRLADALTSFQEAINQLQTAIENLGITDVREQIVAALQNLRQKAEDLLSKVPLPDQLRPMVEQLIGDLESQDFDVLMAPVREVIEQFKVPDEVTEIVNDGLAEARKVIENLVPQQLINSISQEVSQALESIRSFNPASMIPDLSQYLEQAAGAVEKFDPRAIAEEIRGPFQAVLDLLDRAHPFVLLAPVIEAYDSLMNAIPSPSIEPAAQSMAQAIDGAGRVVGRALVEPAARLSPEAQPEIGDPSNPRPVETPSNPSEIRPGDAIRLLGYVPGKLREILRGVEAGAIGDVLSEIDSLSAGLARQLRGVGDAIVAIEGRVERSLDDLFLPVTAAQARAQLAIQANVQGASLTVSLDAVAVAGPAGLRRDLAQSLGGVRQSFRGAHTAVGNTHLAFERAANALESSSLSIVAGDLDRLLAALDPEPIALEIDKMTAAALAKAPALLAELGDDLRLALERLRAIITGLNPISLAQRFLSVLEVLREEIDILNPRRLAAELAEIHAAIRASIEAYDPRLIAADLAALAQEVAGQIRALNPQTLLGDLNFWQATVDRLEALNPATRLQAVGAALRPVGERLAAINIEGLVAAVNELGPVLADEIELLIEALRNEIVALLEALRFATANASASGSLQVA